MSKISLIPIRNNPNPIEFKKEPIDENDETEILEVLIYVIMNVSCLF